MTNVLILDDDEEFARGWTEDVAQALGESASVSAVKQATAAGDIEQLLQRQKTVRAGEWVRAGKSVFDDVDVLVVDYDLVHISEGQARYTGEGICRLARAYSSCRLVVVLNQFVEADFDLSQRGNPSGSHADLNVSSRHVASKGLWNSGEWEPFRPWHWPILPDAAKRHVAMMEHLSQSRTDGLLGALGFTADLANFLTDDAVGFVDSKSRTIAELMKVTLADFMSDNSSSVEHRDGKALREQDVEYRFGLAASRLTKWLKRMVVGPRNLLVDLPHLIQRYPFLLPPDRLNDRAAWEELTGPVPDWLQERIPKDAWADCELWSRVPYVWLPVLDSDEDFREARYDFDYSGAPEWVFAEDHSKFLEPDEAKMFKTDFGNGFDRRFVKNIPGINYAPKRRFAL